MASYAEAKVIKATLEADVARLGAALDAFPKAGPMGLTPDAVKFSLEYRKAKSNFDVAFQRLRNFNASHTRTFREEIAQERRERGARQPTFAT